MTETENKNYHIRLDAGGAPIPGSPGEFEILAITAGDGNGWHFSEEVLLASLELWEGVETFIDHGSWQEGGRSIRDLAGICSQPCFDSQAQGIRLVLRASGPSAGLLEEIGRSWLASPENRPRIGFSADVCFTARGKEVTRIVKVSSLDLVHNPARGGIFIRSLNQNCIEQPGPEPGSPAGALQPGNDPTGKTIGGPMQEENTKERVRDSEKFAEDRALFDRLEKEACACILNAELSAARLPEPAARQVRQRFAGVVFNPGDLQSEIEAARTLAAELQAGKGISGPRITEMAAPEDRLQAAVDDLFGAGREPGMQGRQVERLSGIKELYLRLTGDYDLTGSVSQARLATSATMPALVKNSLNKMLVQKWDDLGRAGYRWWEPVVAIQHFDSLQEISGTLVGEVGDLPEVAEGAEYTELPIADSDETGAWKKYGGYLPLTLELIDRDNLGLLKSYPAKLAAASLRRISGLVASVFTVSSGTGPLMKDGNHVFDLASHHNLGSSPLSAAGWEQAGQAVYRQALLAGAAAGEPRPTLALDPKYLLVPRELRLTGMRILYPSWERETAILSENMQKGEFGDVITVPDWTDADNWAAVCDPRLAPAIIIGERFGLRPEIFVAGDPTSPALFANDELRLKIRHFISVFVADYRPLYKSNYE